MSFLKTQENSLSSADSLQPVTYDVNAFCRAHRISRAHFYKLVKERRGPRLMKVGRRTLISTEAARDWRQAMERPEDQE